MTNSENNAQSPQRASSGLKFPVVSRGLFSASEVGLKRAHYKDTWLAALLLSPQMLILLFFFFIPTFKAVSLAFVQTDPFGGREIFVGLQNFADLFGDPSYRSSAFLTLWFTFAQNFATLIIAGLLAFATDHIILIIGAIIVCAPLYFAFVAGSHTGDAMRSVPQPLLPGNEFFANAKIAWNKVGFGRALINSFIVSIVIVVGKISLAILAGFAITYFRFRFRMTLFWLIFMSLMLPVEVRIVPTYEAVADVAGPIRWLLDTTGLSALMNWMTGIDITAGFHISMINTYSGLSLPLIASASAVFLFRQFFLTVPDDLCEAAKLDGAGPLKFLKDIVLPLSVPNIAALSIIVFVYGWNQYLWPLLFTTQAEMSTVIISLKGLLPGPEDPAEWWSYAMASSFIVMAPPVLVILLLQRWFARGLIDSGK